MAITINFINIRTQKICCYHSKIRTMWLCHRVMGPNDADGMANSVDPDQTDLGLHCLLRPICPKTGDHYGILCCSRMCLSLVRSKKY